MASISLPIVLRMFDANGAVSAGAKLYAYTTGTSTPRAIYSDEALTLQHPVPLVADAQGAFPPVYFDETGGEIKVTITDADDVTLNGYPIDPAPSTSAGAVAASDVSFAPTSEIAETDVQAAIVAVQASFAAPTSIDFTLTDITWDDDQIPGVAVADATTTTPGVVERSTAAEEEAGTADDVVPDVSGVVNIIANQEFGWQIWEGTWNFSDDGAVETITSGQLDDTYEYLIEVKALGHNSGSNQSLKITAIREDDSAGDTVQIADDIAGTENWSGVISFERSRWTTNGKWAIANISDSATLTGNYDPTGQANGASVAVVTPRLALWSFSPQTKIKQLELSTTGGVNFDNGRVQVFRRRVGSRNTN